MRPCAVAVVYGALAVATLAWDAARRQPAAAEAQRSVLAAASPPLALPTALAAPPSPAPVDAAWAPAPVAPAPSALRLWQAAPDAAGCSSFSDSAVRTALALHAADVARAQQSAAAATLLGVAVIAAAGAAARRKAAMRRGWASCGARAARHASPATPSAELGGVPTELEVQPPEVTSAQLTQSSGLLFGGGGGPNAQQCTTAPESPFGTPRRAARAEEEAAATARAWKRNERGRLKSLAAAETLAAAADDEEVISPRL